MSRHERGFIALMSIIIIGAVLLVTVVGASLLGFYSRYNVFDAELKERSAAAAEACAEIARLNLANDPIYDGDDPLIELNSLDKCKIGQVTGSSEKNFHVQGTSRDAVTNFDVTVDASDLSLISWREIPNY